MSTINVSEADFQTVVSAAYRAKEAGDKDDAQALDKIARKINAALTATASAPYRKLSGMPHRPVSWKDMPSVFDV